MKILHKDLFRDDFNPRLCSVSSIASFEVPLDATPLKAVVEDGAFRVYYAVSDRPEKSSTLEVCLSPQGAHIPDGFSVLNEVQIDGRSYWVSVCNVLSKGKASAASDNRLVFLLEEYAHEMSCEPENLSDGEKRALAFATGRLRGNELL